MAGDNFINSKQLRKELGKKIYSRIYLFLGEEAGEKDKAADIIIKGLFDSDEDRKNCVHRFYMDSGDDLRSAVFQAISPAMFSNKTLCLLKNIDNIKQTKENKALLVQLLTELPDSTYLIMTSEKYQAPFIGPEEMKLIKVVKFWKLFSNELAEYIKDTLKKSGIPIMDRAVELIIELAGRDIKKIDESLETLRYSGIKETVTPDMAGNFLNNAADVNIFDFTALLFKQDRGALNLLKKILTSGTPELVILSNITRQADIIEKYHSLIEKGSSMEEAIKNCGVFARDRENFYQMTKLFSSEKICKIYPLLSRADYEIKSGGLKKNILSNPVFNLASEIILNYPV